MPKCAKCQHSGDKNDNIGTDMSREENLSRKIMDMVEPGKRRRGNGSTATEKIWPNSN